MLNYLRLYENDENNEFKANRPPRASAKADCMPFSSLPSSSAASDISDIVDVMVTDRDYINRLAKEPPTHPENNPPVIPPIRRHSDSSWAAFDAAVADRSGDSSGQIDPKELRKSLEVKQLIPAQEKAEKDKAEAIQLHGELQDPPCSHCRRNGVPCKIWPATGIPKCAWCYKMNGRCTARSPRPEGLTAYAHTKSLKKQLDKAQNQGIHLEPKCNECVRFGKNKCVLFFGRSTKCTNCGIYNRNCFVQRDTTDKGHTKHGLLINTAASTHFDRQVNHIEPYATRQASKCSRCIRYNYDECKVESGPNSSNAKCSNCTKANQKCSLYSEDRPIFGSNDLGLVDDMNSLKLSYHYESWKREQEDIETHGTLQDPKCLRCHLMKFPECKIWTAEDSTNSHCNNCTNAFFFCSLAVGKHNTHIPPPPQKLKNADLVDKPPGHERKLSLRSSMEGLKLNTEPGTSPRMK